MNKLALFDIDWTLLESSKAHGLAFNEAFRQIYNVNANHEKLNVSGWTDRKIIFESLKLEELSEESIESKLKEAMQFMGSYFAKIIGDYPLFVMPGVRELLEELYNDKIMLGVLTGNLESIAREKLKIINLNKYFSIGYFGDENQNRTDLVREAVKEAKAYGIEKENIFVIGDTPRDIAAGKEAGTRTIGVATGQYFEKDLIKAEADYVVRNLQDVGSIKKIILG